MNDRDPDDFFGDMNQRQSNNSERRTSRRGNLANKAF